MQWYREVADKDSKVADIQKAYAGKGDNVGGGKK
jgi:hypothetical protein